MHVEPGEERQRAPTIEQLQFQIADVRRIRSALKVHAASPRVTEVIEAHSPCSFL